MASPRGYGAVNIALFCLLWPGLMLALVGIVTWQGLAWACTDFVINVANLTGLTYRDVNALIFFVLWPVVTLGLLGTAIWQAAALRRLSFRQGPARAGLKAATEHGSRRAGARSPLCHRGFVRSGENVLQPQDAPKPALFPCLRQVVSRSIRGSTRSWFGDPSRFTAADSSGTHRRPHRH